MANTEHRTSTCRGCGAQIVWLKTAQGKSIPVEPYSLELGDEQFDHKRHESHFASCGAADVFRRSK